MTVNVKDCYGNQVTNSKDSLEFSTENASTYQFTWYVLGSCVVIFSISCDFNHYRAQTTTRTEMTGEEWTRCLLLGNYAGSWTQIFELCSLNQPFSFKTTSLRKKCLFTTKI